MTFALGGARSLAVALLVPAVLALAHPPDARSQEARPGGEAPAASMDALDELWTLQSRALDLELNGKAPEAQALREQAVNLATRVSGRLDPRVVSALAELGWNHGLQGHAGRWLDYLTEAQDLLELLLASPALADRWGEVGRQLSRVLELARDKDAPAGTRPLVERAVRHAEGIVQAVERGAIARRPEDDESDRILALSDLREVLADALSLLGRSPGAIALLEVDARELEAAHQRGLVQATALLRALSMLADNVRPDRRGDVEARKIHALERELDRAERAPALGEDALAELRRNIGSTGTTSPAIARLHDRLDALVARSEGPDSPRRVGALVGRASAAADKGDYEQTMKMLAELRAVLDAGAGPVARTLVVGVAEIRRSDIGQVIDALVARDQPKHAAALTAALEIAERAVELVDRDLGPDGQGDAATRVIDRLVEIASGYKALGRADAARDRLGGAANRLVRAFDSGALQGDDVSRRLTSILLALSLDDESEAAKRLRSLERTFLEKYVTALGVETASRDADERDQRLARALERLVLSYRLSKDWDRAGATAIRLAELRLSIYQRWTATAAPPGDRIEHPADLLAQAARAFEEAGQVQRAADVYEMAARACAAGDPCFHGAAALYLEAARTFSDAGSASRSQAAAEAAVQHAEQAVARSQLPADGTTATQLSTRLQVLSRAYELVGRLEDAAGVEERLFDLSSRSDQASTWFDPLVHLQSAAGKYNDAGKHDKAITLQRRVAEAKLAAHGPFHKETDDALDTLRRYLVDADRLADAALVVERVIDEYRKRGETSVFADKEATVTVATWFSRLAGIHQAEGRLDDALRTSQQALAIRRRVLPDTDSDVVEAVVDIANVHRARGALAEAVRVAEIALSLARSRGARDIAVRGLGPLLVDLGQLERARALVQVVSQESEEVGDSIQKSHDDAFGQGRLGSSDPVVRAVGNATRIISTKVRIKPLLHLGLVYLRLGDVAEASTALRRALTLSEQIQDRSPDFVRLLILLGQAEATLGHHDVALAHDERAFQLASRMFRPGAPERVAILLGRAEAESRRGQASAAVLLYEQAQAEAQLRPDSIVRAEAQVAYAQHFARQKQWALAILLGKGAVNAAQSARASLSAASQEVQQAFARSRSTVYHGLAGWLVEQGRLPEAQQVLAMLKEEELFQYLRSETQDVRKTQATLTPEEAQWAARFAAIRTRLAAVGAELEALEQKAAREGLSDAEKARRAALERDREVGQQAFEKYLGELLAEIGRTASTERNREIGQRNLGNLQALQDTLSDLGHGAVTLHYLVLEDRLHIILTTPQVQLVREARVPASELNRAIQQYRQVLQDPTQDPLPMAQSLYRWLIGPVASDLQQAQAQTLMVSLDGALRYLPLAALHDGVHYLAEQYALAIYTEAARDRLKDRAGPRWRLAGLGLTRQVQGFSPLPSVKQELEGILQSGALPGELWFDEQFTADRLLDVLDKRPPVLHIASHFVFRPGAEANSFLLLGDGTRLSLADLKRYRFRDVDLITLSACETAVGGGKDVNGREIEGFGALAQRQGAKGVLATLWPVADHSTGQFMQTFYRIREAEAGISKAEALRRAQVEFIRGTPSASGDGGALRHPFFWAPFILMGNWR